LFCPFPFSYFFEKKAVFFSICRFIIPKKVVIVNKNSRIELFLKKNTGRLEQ